MDDSLHPIVVCEWNYKSMSWTQSWLTHWGPDEMAAILQTIFSKAFSSMKIFVFWLKFHRSLYLRVYLIDNNLVLVRIIGLAPNRRQVITWTNDGLFYRRIYASLGLIEIISVKSPKVFLFYLSTICTTSICKLGRSLAYTRNDFNYLCHVSVDEW